jgi:hypothetical protein
MFGAKRKNVVMIALFYFLGIPTHFDPLSNEEKRRLRGTLMQFLPTQFVFHDLTENNVY